MSLFADLSMWDFAVVAGVVVAVVVLVGRGLRRAPGEVDALPDDGRTRP